jgi:hypothetical protein
VILTVVPVKTLHLLYQNFFTDTVKKKQQNPVKAVNPQPEFKPGISQVQYLFAAVCNTGSQHTMKYLRFHMLQEIFHYDNSIYGTSDLTVLLKLPIIAFFLY